MAGLGERRAYIWTDLGARERGETGADSPLWNNRRTPVDTELSSQCSFISSDRIIKSGTTEGDRKNGDY